MKAHSTFHVVTADNRLRKACENLPHVAAHDTWESLLRLPELAVPLSARTEIGDFCREEWSEFESLVSAAIPERVSGEELVLELDGKLEIGTLVKPGTITMLDFDWADRFVYSDHVLSVPLNCKLNGSMGLFELERGELPKYERFKGVVVNDLLSSPYISLEFVCDVHVEAEVGVEVVRSLKGESRFERVAVHRVGSLSVMA